MVIARPQRNPAVGWVGGGQRLIVHKSSRSIVSGEPPAARAGVVPMDRRPTGPSRPLRFHPVSPSGWEVAKVRRGPAPSGPFDASHHHNRSSKQTLSGTCRSLAVARGDRRRRVVFWLECKYTGKQQQNMEAEIYCAVPC